MRSLFRVCNAVNIQQNHPHFTAVLMSVLPQYLGNVYKELQTSTLVNANSEEAAPGWCPVRTVTWQKVGKWGQQGGMMVYDTEHLAMGFNTKDGKLPHRPFREWGPDPYPASSILQIPVSRVRALDDTGKQSNAASSTPFLGFTVNTSHVYIDTICIWCVYIFLCKSLTENQNNSLAIITSNVHNYIAIIIMIYQYEYTCCFGLSDWRCVS